MSNLAKLIRPLLLLAALAAFALPAAGCGTTSADPERGRLLFIEECGACHAMAQAGTSGTAGPDLDAAFAAARAVGQNDATVEGVVKAQVESPRPTTNNTAVSMPADIVSGQDLEDVAAYVGLYAGVPGAAPPKVPGGPGAQVFANAGCAGCHALAEANAGGVTGPDLDEVLPGQDEAMVRDSIVDPSKNITPGYPDVMPDNFEQSLSSKELEDLVEYLIQSTSGKGGAKGKGGSANGPTARASGG